MSNLLQPLKCLTAITRNLGRGRGKNVYRWNDEGIRYPGFTYYPRHPDFQDPPYEATKLFRVQRIKPVKGTPYWERNILKELNLTGNGTDIAIVKNIPETNARLWKIKHLIKITPITFPNGFPKDINGTMLKENGELEVKHQVGIDIRLEATEKFVNNPRKIDGNTLRRDSRMKWLSGWH